MVRRDVSSDGTQIAEWDQQIATLTDQVRLRDRAIRDLQDLLASARREAKAALTSATDTQRAVEIYRAQVEDREYRLDMLQEAFDEQAARLTALQQELDEQAGRLGVPQETFDEQAERLSVLQTTLDQQTEHLDALRAQVEFMSSREDELRQMLLDAHEQLLARDAELQHAHILEARVSAAEAELESARAFIEQVRSSKVWMLARLYWAPIGWLKKLLGR